RPRPGRPHPVPTRRSSELLKWEMTAESGSPANVIEARNDDPGGPTLGFFAVPPVLRQSITGATTQDQVDSLVAALAALGLVTDEDRKSTRLNSSHVKISYA